MHSAQIFERQKYEKFEFKRMGNIIALPHQRYLAFLNMLGA